MNKVPFISLDQAKEISMTYPTPFHIYNEDGIRNTVKLLKQAFSWNKGFKEYFAVKATPTPGILKILKDEGCGMDCATLTELQLVNEYCNVSGDDIMFSSNVTPAEDFVLAAKLNSIINFDDIEHIAFYESLGLPFLEKMSCRYNPGGDFKISGEIMGAPKEAKYGMTKEQLKKSYITLKEKGVKQLGIHAFFASAQTNEIYYPELSRQLFELVVELKKELDIDISFINLSGGIGIPYLPEECPVDILKIGKDIETAYNEVLFKNNILNVDIFTELGRYMLGPNGALVTQVIHMKEIYKSYVGVDACAANLMRPAIYGSYHHITNLGKMNEKCDTIYDVIGGLCENNDKFAIDRSLPKTKVGDYIYIHDSGAHGFSMGYNYNGKLRSAELLLQSNGNVKLIRRAETPKDYFATLNI